MRGLGRAAFGRSGPGRSDHCHGRFDMHHDRPADRAEQQSRDASVPTAADHSDLCASAGGDDGMVRRAALDHLGHGHRWVLGAVLHQRR